MDTQGFNEKMDSLQELARAVSLLPLDAAGYAQFKLVDEILNLPESAIHPVTADKGAGIIRRITGMLVRSVSLDREGNDKVRLYMNTAIAGYAEKVDTWARNRYGMGYIELFLGFYEKELLDTMQKEITQALLDIKAGRKYKYYNPFPVAA